MIQELVEFGKRITEGKSRALKDELFSIVIAINEEGEFQKFIISEKKTIISADFSPYKIQSGICSGAVCNESEETE